MGRDGTHAWRVEGQSIKVIWFCFLVTINVVPFSGLSGMLVTLSGMHCIFDQMQFRVVLAVGQKMRG